MRERGAIAGPLDVVLVLALFLYVQNLMRKFHFSDWQISLFGSPLVSSVILFFILPMMVVWIRGLNPGRIGVSGGAMKYRLRVTSMAIGYILPAAMLFPVIEMIGSSYLQWLGAVVLALGFGTGGALFMINSKKLASYPERDAQWKESAYFMLLLVGGLALSAIVHTELPLAARIIRVLVFVGFLEEFLFRGFIQSRLNDYFGRPFSFANVRYGPGLILAALAFGLFHPITVVGSTPWAWALWTSVLGLVFGFAREKTGSVVTPALMHGVIVLPTAFFNAA
jgi:membrane protease YdiL (CAAX protease family)